VRLMTLLVPSNSPQPANSATGALVTQRHELAQALIGLVGEATDPKVQVEASRLLTCMIDYGPKLNESDFALARSALSALQGKSCNTRVAKYARNRLELDHRNQRRGFVPWLSRRLGDSAVYAMLIGVVFSAALWTVAFVLILTVGAWWNEAAGTAFILPPEKAKPLAFAAFVGGLVSLLSRVNQFANLYIFDPFLIFVNSLLKPLIGAVLALTMFAILESGIVEIKFINFEIEGSKPRFIFWAFGFIAGFSERLAGDFIARAESVVGATTEKRETSK
jgi:hypothetical protein